MALRGPIFVQHPGVAGVPDGSQPTISSIAPASTPINTPVQITITGTNFKPSSVVKLDGNNVVCAYVSPTQMTADIPGFGVPDASKDVTVVTDGKTSAVKNFAVTAT